MHSTGIGMTAWLHDCMTTKIWGWGIELEGYSYRGYTGWQVPGRTRKFLSKNLKSSPTTPKSTSDYSRKEGTVMFMYVTSDDPLHVNVFRRYLSELRSNDNFNFTQNFVLKCSFWPVPDKLLNEKKKCFMMGAFC